MIKAISMCFVALIMMGISTAPAWASDEIRTRAQVVTAIQHFNATMMSRMSDQAKWGSCSTFRIVWEDSFNEVNADLEASFKFYAQASTNFIDQHWEAFGLVNAIARKYLHNNCIAIPYTDGVIAKSKTLDEIIVVQY